MTLRTLILRSLRFHWRSHLGVLLGAAIGSAALIGALVVGDSVRGSLRDRALERLRYVRFVLDGQDRTFTDSLGERMPRDLMDNWTESSDGEALDTWVWFAGGPGAVLRLPGTASVPGGEARANHVTVLGIWQLPQDHRHNHYYDFWNYTGWFDAPVIAPEEVWLNESLARQLEVKAGDTVLLRLRKPSALSADTPMSPRGDHAVALRLRVGRVLGAEQLGNFSLRASATPPLNAFVNLRALQQALDLPGRANLLVTGGVMEERHTGSFAELQQKLRAQGSAPGRWLADKLPASKAQYRAAAQAQVDFQAELTNGSRMRLADYDASLRWPPGSNGLELMSRRIFLDPPLVRAALTQHKTDIVWTNQSGDLSGKMGTLSTTNAAPLLTYLVNLLRAGTNATPYSMVTAAGAPWTPNDLRDDEILVNHWLADDLRVKAGDEIELVYFLPESGAALLEATNRFRVRGIVPLAMPWADRTLMPEFPGIEKAESTADWDTAFPLVHKIRDQDEAYWKQHRGTPKAFVTLAAGQKLWGNRFGKLTAIRFPVPDGFVRQNLPDDAMLGARKAPVDAFQFCLEEQILATLKPEEVGLRWEPVREQALQAAAKSQDFGGLFIGFSFFLIAAALLLMALLFQFGVEQRVTEVGTLLALGFPPKQVRRLWLAEGAALAFLGGILGAAGGVAYARAMLHGLGTLWRDAVGGTTLGFHVSATTLAAGVAASTVVAVVVIWLTLRKLGRRPARELLAGEGEKSEVCNPESEADRTPALRVSQWLRLLPLRWASLAGAIGLAAFMLARGDSANAGAFFGAGALVLISGLSFLSSSLSRSVRPNPSSSLQSPSSFALALRGMARRRSRSVATAALLACGSFLIASIGVFRLDADRDATQRTSGTGGFALIGESTLPIFQDLNTRAGREALALNDTDLQGVTAVPFRVRAGDEASCLNLNRAQQPRLLGVQPAALEGRFTFTQRAGWGALQSAIRDPQSAIEVSAIGDAASIQWAMGKKVGDAIDYVDERGQPFKVRIVGAVANSILQGSLVIDEAEFVKRFPSASGRQFFLLDAPTNRLAEVSAALSRGLRDYGLELTPAARRLAQFNAVQNTYLGTFQILGGLGLLLGSAGLGIVVLRNVLERRGELAVLLALGWRRSQVRRLVLVEHAALLAAGLGLGILAAGVAVLPALLVPGGALPWRSLAPTLAGVALAGVAAAWGGTHWALRGNLLAALRNE
jgi:putative ABC transport system permease protein